MEILKNTQEGTITLAPIGCLDTSAATEFDAALTSAIEESKTIKLDFSNLEFISSSALRSIVSARKKLAANGNSLTLKSLSPLVREVFEMTGLINVFTIEG